MLRLHEIAKRRLVTFSVMFALGEAREGVKGEARRGERKQNRYLTPANGNCHSLITDLEEAEQSKHGAL